MSGIKSKNQLNAFIDEIKQDRRYISWLERRHGKQNSITVHTSPNIYKLIIEHLKMKPSVENMDAINQYAVNNYAVFKAECLDEESLLWLMPSDSRLCYFCWRVLFRIHDCNINFPKMDSPINALNSDAFPPSSLIKPRVPLPQQNPLQPGSVEISQPTKPVGARNAVIYYVDALNITLEQKERLLACMRDLYLDASKTKPLENWLNKTDHEQLIWVEQYLKNKTDFDKRLVGDKLLLNDIQSYLDVLSLIDKPVWQLTMAQMKKAWTQKKYRDSREDKKQYSFDMSIDVAQFLDVLSKHEKKSKGDLIESLIKEKYYQISLIENPSM